jgi:predicted enzyme related to lactoylglutathione lyase
MTATTPAAFPDLGRPGAALSHLLDPMDPAVFVSEYWERRPLHLTGRQGRYERLFDMDAFLAAVARQDEVGLVIRVSADHEGDAGGASAHLPIDASQLAEAFDRGASVCVDPIDRAAPTLAAYAAALKRDLGHPGAVSVKCYLSPRGYGFNAHFDAHIVTQLQIEGRKRWRYSVRPGVVDPLDNGFADEGGEVRVIGRSPSELRSWERASVADATFEEVVLEPGDLLCLPPGTWHEAKAVERSLALNVAFSAFSPWDLIANAIRGGLVDDVAWRRGVPPSPAGGPGVPGAVQRVVADRIGDLIRVLRELDPSGEPVARAWQAAVAGDITSEGSPLGSLRIERAAGDDTAGSAAGSLGYRGGVSCVLTVSSVREAVAWYVSVLGMRVVAIIPEFGWAELATATPDVRIGLTELGSAGVTGGAVVSLGVADIAKARRTLEATAVSFDGPIQDVTGVTRLTVFSDPYGNRLMLHESD